MKNLELNQLYTREEVHQIFSPDTKFTPQAGTWGLQGIVRIPDRINDFVFFVTYGQSQGSHDFDEGISSEGVLTWQSQPSQGFDNSLIRQFISHNHHTENIYLFLRESKGKDYQYFGRLEYRTHDTEREKPVHFQWQLVDWDKYQNSTPKQSTLLKERPSPSSASASRLVISNHRPKSKRTGSSNQTFKSKKSPDYAVKDANNRTTGLSGELLVLEFERDRLITAGREDLASMIIHASVVEGDGAGYDIRSFNADASSRYIEVKTTVGSIDSDFYMSPNEIRFSESHSSNFYLYRVYDLKSASGEAQVYIMKGNILESFNATPTNFRMSFEN